MKYVSGACNRIRKHGPLAGLRVALSEGIEIFLQRIGQHVNYGESPFNEDWDILILLDACRYDLFKEYAPKHDLYSEFNSIESRYSPASTTKEWIRKVYHDGSEDVLAETHLVSANGFEQEELSLSKFGEITPVWEHHDSKLGTIPPDVVTDAAIHVGRTTDCSKLIVHYMQPHAPFVHASGKFDSVNEAPAEGKSQNIWEGLRTGRFELDNVWSDYGKNLLTALDEVERLVQNINGKVAISADHANAIGEFGVYGHPSYVPLPSLKRVPWVCLQATDEQTDHPDDPIMPGVTGSDLDEHLHDLGYRT